MTTIKHVSNIGGTSRMGEVETTYARLVEVFGEPTHDWGAGDRVRVEWDLEIDGILATIYDWKSNEPIETYTDWHIGGKTIAAAVAVEYALREVK